MSAKASALRELTDQELWERLAELRQELFNLRFQKATGRLDNYMRIRQVRREIARVLTLLRERELGIEVEPAQAPREKRRSRRLLRRWTPPTPESEGAEEPEDSVEDAAGAGERPESDAAADSTVAEPTGEDTNLADKADFGSESEEQGDPAATAADDEANDSSEAELEAKRGSQDA